MSRRAASRLAWSTCAVSVAFAAVGQYWLLSDAPRLGGYGYDPSIGARVMGILFASLSLLFGALGAVIAGRRPKHAIGWLFCAFGFVNAVADSFSYGYSMHGLFGAPGSLPAAAEVAWFYEWSFWLLVAGMLVLLLLFPTGRLASPRLRPVTWVLGAAVLIGTVCDALSPGRLGSIPVGNPFGVAGAVGSALKTATGIAQVLMAPALLLCFASVFLRFRRAKGDERQQLKWFSFAVGLMSAWFGYLAVVSAVAPTLLQDNELVGAVSSIGFFLTVLGVPVSTALAILKYRLYDIDRIINKTLVYGAVTVLLGLAYAGGVVLAQAVLPMTDDSPAVVAITTLAVVALFRPLRNRVQGFVDIRFYRRRYDAARTIESFGSRLRQETDLEALRTQLVGLVNDTMQPTHVSLWLRHLDARR